MWQPTEHYILPITVTLFVLIAFKLKSTNVLLQVKKKMNTNNNIENPSSTVPTSSDSLLIKKLVVLSTKFLI